MGDDASSLPLTVEAVRAAIARVAAPSGLDIARVPLAVAVSGGADSLALVLLAAEAFPGRVTGVTVDHGLRPEAAAEAVQVQGWLGRHGIPHATVRWEGEKPSGNLQATARLARYRLLAAWCRANGVPVLLSAHHQDDVAETLLQRLSRGSGLAGLAAMPALRRLDDGVDGVWLARPLLDVPRARLRATLAARGQAWVEDPSNGDDRFDRARARRWLETQPDLSARRLALAAHHLAEADSAIHWMVKRHLAGYVARREDGAVAVADPAAFLDVPGEVLRRSVAWCLGAVVAGATPRGAALDRLISSLRAGRPSTLAGCQAGFERGSLVFRPEAPRRH